MDYHHDHDLDETRAWQPIDPSYQERHKKKRKRRRRFPVLLLLSLLALGMAGLGYLWASGWGELDSDQRPGLVAPVKGVTPVLLLGEDERNPQQPGRTDTIIVAFLDANSSTVRMLSIPRDTYTDIPGRSTRDKINAAQVYGHGPQATTRAVSDLLGIDVHYYVETNFQGFQKIVDTLGGVTIKVDRRMYYPAEGIDLSPGTQRLDGKDALAFVRFRGYANADIGRIEHQQQFFKAVAREATKITNIWKIPSLIMELNSAVKTNLNTAQLIRLVERYKSIDSSQIKGYTLPGYGRYMGGISYWMPDRVKGKMLAEALAKGSEPPEISPEEPAPEQSGGGTVKQHPGKRGVRVKPVKTVTPVQPTATKPETVPEPNGTNDRLQTEQNNQGQDPVGERSAADGTLRR